MSTPSLTFENLKQAVQTGTAFRCRAALQPAGGPGDKVFPPTYAGAVYAVEERRLPGREDNPVTCVLLDSIQSQANRMEEALQDAVDEGRIRLPVIEVDFSEADLVDPVDRVTSLQAPHRIADAILRDSLLDGVPFRHSEVGKAVDRVSTRNATPLYELCPTALIFGMWDSTGPKGGLGAKFARAMVSEIVGINAAFGTKTSSRIDPLQIQAAATIYQRDNTKGGLDWTPDDEDEMVIKDKKGNPVLYNRSGSQNGKPGNPSKANHSNYPPSLSDVDRRTGRPLAGGVTIEAAEQMTVLSLPALRRLCFPVNGEAWKPTPEQKKRDEAGRMVLAALGLCSAALAVEKGLDLRSRCLLWPEQELNWELLTKPGANAQICEVSADNAIKLLTDACSAAADLDLDWRSEPLVLKPAPQLIDLVRRSQELAAEQGTEDGEES